MLSLVYVSSASRPFDKAELMELLAISRRNNQRLDVTGLLLHNNGNFLQVLEGEQSAVEGLYQKIATDSRHKAAVIILRTTPSRREFPDWSMAFKDDSPELQKLTGFSDFFNEDPASDAFAQQAGTVTSMLQTLRSTFLR